MSAPDLARPEGAEPSTTTPLTRETVSASDKDRPSAREGHLLAEGRPTLQFLADVRAVVVDHWSGLPEDRPHEYVWARLDAVLFDDEGASRVQPDYEARP